jgi:hypothetical protein
LNTAISSFASLKWKAMQVLYDLDVLKNKCLTRQLQLIMKKLFYISHCFSLVLFSQNEQLAQYYYDKGDFEKAKSAMKNC